MNLSTLFELATMIEDLCNADARVVDYTIDDGDKCILVRLSNDKEFMFKLD